MKPSRFLPSQLNTALSGTGLLTMRYGDVADTGFASTSSFRYDMLGSPLKSSQQLRIDWSRFENHTFFSSAEVNVNTAFDRVINEYPFDGTRTDLELFIDSLTGFERWVFDNFPRWRGALHFSGTQVGEEGLGGTWIEVNDIKGGLYPDLTKNPSGEPVLNPVGNTSLSIETLLKLPTNILTGRQVICQKASGIADGFWFIAHPALTVDDEINIEFYVSSAGNTISAIAPIKRGQWEHVCATWNRDNSNDRIELYVDEQLVATSSIAAVGDLNIRTAPLYIGSGSTLVNSWGGTYTPTQTFSGSLDEFRVFHSVRTIQQQQHYARRPLTATPELKLYLRFNEPVPPLSDTPTDNINEIVIDSSGNALHSRISNFWQFSTVSSSYLRVDASNDWMTLERDESCPTLFPAHPDVVALNLSLLSSASAYDAANPNLISKLIPQHYLLEGAAYDGFYGSLNGGASDPYAGGGISGTGKMGSTQVILSFLYIWAKFFDELKVFVDSFAHLDTVDYSGTDNVPDLALAESIKRAGFTLPPLFNDTSIDQFINLEPLNDNVTPQQSLVSVQRELMRRVLINLPDIVRSKGTLHSVQSFLRALGVDPNNTMRLREFGGPTTKNLRTARENRFTQVSMYNLSGSTGYFVTDALTGSKVEPGWPYPSTSGADDTLLLSGSWTIEGMFRFVGGTSTDTNQSIFRLCSLGTAEWLLGNLVATKNQADPDKSTLTYYQRSDTIPPFFNPSGTIPLTITGSFFDSEVWSFAVGKKRRDEIGNIASSSFYIWAAKRSDEGTVTKLVTTASFVQDVYNPAPGVSLTSADVGDPTCAYGTTFNQYGNYLTVGPGQTILYIPSTVPWVLNSNVVPDITRTTAFSGRIANLRFWSKSFQVSEWLEHVRNPNSMGVTDPHINYNYVTHLTGSWNKIRMSVFDRQTEASATPLGTFLSHDTSQNNRNAYGTGIQTDRPIQVGEQLAVSFISPIIDEASSNEKIRVRGYQDATLLADRPWALISPVYELQPAEPPTDDNRFVIEFSLVEALSRDIVTIFSTMDEIDNAIGSPELAFSPDYPDLEHLRDIYFNRVSDKLNFRDFFEFYRWFDKSIAGFIEQLVSRKTDFLGTNFTIESHMLERHKVEHRWNEMYLPESTRGKIRDVLLLQQIAGTFRKY